MLSLSRAVGYHEVLWQFEDDDLASDSISIAICGESSLV